MMDANVAESAIGSGSTVGRGVWISVNGVCAGMPK